MAERGDKVFYYVNAPGGDPEAPTLTRHAAMYVGSGDQGDAIFVFGSPDAFPYATQPNRVWAQYSEQPAHECWSLG